MITRTDIALKVNHLEQSVCGLRADVPQTDSRAADNRQFGNMAERRIYSQLFVRYLASAPADE